jgi:hypothetical protein
VERPLNTQVRPTSLDKPVASDEADGPMTLKDIITDGPDTGGVDPFRDRADALLPRLKGNERVVFEALLTGSPTTTQRDIAEATGLTEGAVSKILRRIATKAG